MRTRIFEWSPTLHLLELKNKGEDQLAIHEDSEYFIDRCQKQISGKLIAY